MKLSQFLIAASFFTSYAAMAALTGDSLYSENRLDALHFRLAKAGSDFSLSTSAPLQNTTQFTQSNQNTYLDNAKSNSYTGSFAYGFSDQVSASVSISDLSFNSKTSTNQIYQTTTSSNAEGFSDPVLHLSYRFYGELIGLQFAGLTMDYSPNTGAQNFMYPGYDGNNLRGDTYLQLTANFQQVLEKQEVAAGFSWQNYSSRVSNALNPNNNQQAAAYSRAYINLIYRFHFVENQYIEAATNVNLPYNQPYSQSNGYSAYSHYNLTFFPGIYWGILLRSDWLITASYTFSNYTFQNNPIANANNTDTIYGQVNTQSLAAAFTHLL